jgi:hypothetical protein
MGDVDIVIDLDPGKGPGARRKFSTGGIHAPARHAETGIGIGSLRIVDAGRPEHVARTLADGPIGRLAVIDLQVGTAVLDFGKGLEIFVSKTHAAIGAAAINAKIISGHAGVSVEGGILRCRFGADHNAKDAKTKVG